MSDDALRSSGAWMGAQTMRPNVVGMLGLLFTAHDQAEREKVRRERQTGVEDVDDAHAWVERVCTYAMRLATDAEIDAAMDGHEGLRYSR